MEQFLQRQSGFRWRKISISGPRRPRRDQSGGYRRSGEGFFLYSERGDFLVRCKEV